MFTLHTKISMLKAILTKNNPFYVQMYVSKNCHLKCKMCNVVSANKGIELFNLEQAEQIAQNLKKIGVGVIVFTGGEPFLSPHIEELVEIFKGKGFDVRLQTAGLPVKFNELQSCFKKEVKDVSISLDTLKEDLADYINGVDGSWKNIIKTVSFVSKELKGTKSICAFGAVLSKYNIDEIEPLLEFATRIGWWLSIPPVHVGASENENFRKQNNEFAFVQEDYTKIKELIEKLKKLKKKGALLFNSDDFLDSAYSYITTKKETWRHNGICDSPNLYFVIKPDGKFAPCADYDFIKDVYLYDKNFPEVFKSKEFREEVKELMEKCPGCNYGCFAEMTLSVRSPKTFKERLLTQFSSNVIKPFEEDELLQIIEEIKSKYSIYNEKNKDEKQTIQQCG